MNVAIQIQNEKYPVELVCNVVNGTEYCVSYQRVLLQKKNIMLWLTVRN